MVGRLGDLWEWTVLNHQHSLALSECNRKIGGREPPVKDLRSSKADCKQGRTVED